MDPVITAIIVICMSLLFAVAAMHKIKSPLVFRTAMQEYRLLPPVFLVPASMLVMISETLAAALALIPATRPIGLSIMTVLLFIYAAGIGINLLRGRRDIDCGCNGPASKQMLSWWLVARNLLFLGLILLAMQPTNGRQFLWLDSLTVLFGVMVASGLYLSLNRLLAQAPGITGMRGTA
jgi:hypothetical protein